MEGAGSQAKLSLGVVVVGGGVWTSLQTLLGHVMTYYGSKFSANVKVLDCDGSKLSVQ